MDQAGVIDAFRRAAFGMGAWSEALAGYAAAQRANIVQVTAHGADLTIGVDILHGTSRDEEAAYMRLNGADPRHNPRVAMVLSGPAHVSLVDEQFMTQRDRDRIPVFREVFARVGADHSSLLPLIADGFRGSLNAMRGRTAGPPTVEERRFADAIGPAVSGSLSHALVLGTVVDGAMLRTAEMLAGAVILLDCHARPLSLSPAAEAVLRRGTHLTVRAGRIAAAARGDAAMLDDALAAVMDPGRYLDGIRKGVLRGGGGASPLSIDVSPLPVRSSGPLSRARAMLTIRTPRPIEAAQVRRAFALTAAEAEVALLLADGHDPAAIAGRRASTVATVRTQVKSILAKTGTTRTLELVALLRRTL